MQERRISAENPSASASIIVEGIVTSSDEGQKYAISFSKNIKISFQNNEDSNCPTFQQNECVAVDKDRASQAELHRQASVSRVQVLRFHFKNIFDKSLLSEKRNWTVLCCFEWRMSFNLDN